MKPRRSIDACGAVSLPSFDPEHRMGKTQPGTTAAQHNWARLRHHLRDGENLRGSRDAAAWHGRAPSEPMISPGTNGVSEPFRHPPSLGREPRLLRNLREN